MNLFQLGKFALRSGPSTWKIECDALTDDDWDCLAPLTAENAKTFTHVYAADPKSKNAIKFAAALKPYASVGGPRCALVCDDVLTSGTTMSNAREDLMLKGSWPNQIIGVVAFDRSRGKCPAWVLPLFVFTPYIPSDE